MSRTLSIPLAPRGQQGNFNGIDRRRIESSSNPNSSHVGDNIDLTPGGVLRRRDALRIFCQLPAGTFGLYTANDSLRVAVPAGYGTEFQLPPNIVADVFGNSSSRATPRTRYERVSSASFYGRDSVKGPYMYLVLESSQRLDPKERTYEHHYIDNFPDVMGHPRRTTVELNFQPGGSLYKYQGKFFAPGRSDDLVHHSSIVNGPRDWTNPADAGVFAPGQHTGGASDLQGFTQHEGLLGCVYANAMQFWQLDADPANMNWIKTYEGPGTTMFRSLATVTGDTYYFSEGGFRSLVTEVSTGERRESDFGAAVQDLTQEYENWASPDVSAIWSPARSQYLCCFASPDKGTTKVFAYTISPAGRVAGWTTWDLPIAVEDVVELEGTLYVRSNDCIYFLDPNGSGDEVAGRGIVPFKGVIETQFYHAGDMRTIKDWASLDVVASGTYDVLLLPDEHDRGIQELIAVDMEGSTAGGPPFMLGVTAQTIALRFEAAKPFELHTLAIGYSKLRGAR